MNTYDNLNKRCETVVRCLPDAPFRHTVSGIYAELFSEIDRLNREVKAWKDASEKWDCSTPEELKNRIFTLPEIY